jgi:hypothetical protein
MHFVHYKSTFANLTAAAESTDADALAVVGVFLDAPIIPPFRESLGVAVNQSIWHNTKSTLL